MRRHHLPVAAMVSQRGHGRRKHGCRRRIPGGKRYKRTRNSIMQSGIERELTGDLPFPGTLTEGDHMSASIDAEQKFDRVKAQLKARLGTEVYSSWFGRMKVAEASRGIVRISVPTAF